MLPAVRDRGAAFRWREPPVLSSAWFRADPGSERESIQKSALQPLPFRAAHVNLESVPQKIIRSCVLIQTPHQIPNRVDEVLLIAGRCVEEQIMCQLE